MHRCVHGRAATCIAGRLRREGRVLNAGGFQVMEEHCTILPGGLERDTRIILYGLFHMSSRG